MHCNVFTIIFLYFRCFVEASANIWRCLQESNANFDHFYPFVLYEGALFWFTIPIDKTVCREHSEWRAIQIKKIIQLKQSKR